MPGAGGAPGTVGGGGGAPGMPDGSGGWPIIPGGGGGAGGAAAPGTERLVVYQC